MKEAREFLKQKINECELFTHKEYPKKRYYIWDKQLIRIKKLQRLSGKKKIEFKPGKNSIILFEIDSDLILYDYDNVYDVLNNKYKFNNSQINLLIQKTLTKFPSRSVVKYHGLTNRCFPFEDVHETDYSFKNFKIVSSSLKVGG